MRALITGGAGFIGSNIAAELRRTGHAVTVLDNLSSGYASNLGAIPGVRFIEGDIRDTAAVSEAIAGCDTVFHLAASVGNKRSIDAPILDAEINAIGTLRVLEAARAAGVCKLVASSSAGIFGELKQLPIAEDHPLRPLTPYGTSKLAMENYCLSYNALYDLEVVCLRYFNVYGPNQRFDAYGNVIPIFVFKALAGEGITIFGDGEQTRDFINVRDVVQANIKAAQAKGVSGAFNIASATRISINGLVEMLGEALGAPILATTGPERPGDVRDSLADVSAARRAFGFDPGMTLEAGLPEYVRWARAEAGRAIGSKAA